MCSALKLEAHDAEVDTSSEVLALIGAAGGYTADLECSTDQQGSALPQFVNDACHASGNVSSFDCAAVATPLNNGKQRLCRCHHSM